MASETIAINPAISELAKKIKLSFAPSQVLLFGSRAKGEEFNNSDWDLLVVSDKFEGIPFRERIDQVLALIEKPIGQDVEAFCYTHKEVEERKKELGLVKTAIETGITL